MIVLGIDPGGAATGVVLADTASQSLYRAELVERPDGGDLGEHLEACGAAVERMIDTDAPAFPELVAIEGLVEPNAHLGLANVVGLLDAAQVLGWLRAHVAGWPIPHVIVRPASFGTAPLAHYPRKLVGPRERKGTGRYRHLRSAYDVALAAPAIHRHGDLAADHLG